MYQLGQGLILGEFCAVLQVSLKTGCQHVLFLGTHMEVVLSGKSSLTYPEVFHSPAWL